MPKNNPNGYKKPGGLAKFKDQAEDLRKKAFGGSKGKLTAPKKGK